MILVSTLPTRSTRSTALRLIYVFRCFRGPIFVRQKPQSKCTHCSICAGRYPVLCKMGDAPALDLITPEAGAIYVMDRGYVDFQRLYVIHQAGAFFVTRTKVNMKYHRVYSHPVPGPATGVGSDQSIALDGFYTKQDYPQHLRRVSFRDPETGLHLVFLTNNFTLSATMIAALYKKRWAVELFFKWIKQNLRIK